MPPKLYPYALQDSEAVPEHKGSFGPPGVEQGSPSSSLQVPDTPTHHGLEAVSTLPLQSNANGLAIEDVAADMPGRSSFFGVFCGVFCGFRVYSQVYHLMLVTINCHHCIRTT